jgi:hypothetical protein
MERPRFDLPEGAELVQDATIYLPKTEEHRAVRLSVYELDGKKLVGFEWLPRDPNGAVWAWGPASIAHVMAGLASLATERHNPCS